MATRKKSAATGRKSAYVARNRATIINAALEVLADNGLHTTMDQVAEASGMAVSTVYKHFKDKRDLITATTTLAFEEWESWVAKRIVEVSDPLEQLVMPMRLFLRAKATHPEYAQLVAKNFGVVSQILPELTGTFTAQVNALNKAKVLNVENTPMAIHNLLSVVVIQLVNQTLNPKATAAEGDLAIRIALSMLGISEGKAKKLTESKIIL